MATVGERERIDAQHARGRLTARERIDVLLDEGSFAPIGAPGAGVVTGSGTINHRPVFVFGQDVTDRGGAVTPDHAARIADVVDRAILAAAPLIGLHDSPGLAMSDGLSVLGSQTALLQRQVTASGIVPQIALVMGDTAGLGALSPALADIVFMMSDATLLLAGPDILRMATGELASAQMLGGAAMHADRTGLADRVFSDEIELLLTARELVDILPLSAAHPVPHWRSADPPNRIEPGLDTLVPLDPDTPYDMRELVRKIADEREVFELQPANAGSILCAFARIEGRSVGIVASQPMVLDGVIDVAAAHKAARFVRLCDGFGMPLVCLVDSPGFLPGTAAEQGGMVCAAAALLAAFATAGAPRVTIVTRRAFGGIWSVIAPVAGAAHRIFAWPGAEIALVGAQAASEMLFAASDEKRRDYVDRFANPYPAQEGGFIDAVIRPQETRGIIATALREMRGAPPSRAAHPA